MADSKFIANPGSAIGEAVGASMERALTQKLESVAGDYGCRYLTSGIASTKSGAPSKKLLMYDSRGNRYDIDGVFIDGGEHPLILVESKYIRYTKHNRDKGSWICTAHSAVRRRYHSIRASVVVLAGNWSHSSMAMMRSNDINLFVIPFSLISELLAAEGVNFNWEEKDKTRAAAAWRAYSALPESRKNTVGERMIASIGDNLASLIGDILDNSRPRRVQKIVVEIVSNLGETKVFEFKSVEQAMEFLSRTELEKSFLEKDSATLRDIPGQD
ncbi:MAG: hypothetical protein ACR2QC_06380 [Gammaproteobacteria bacterium]